MAYIFTANYQFADHDCDPDALVQRLGSAGCDDALVGVGQPGRLALEFSREGAAPKRHFEPPWPRSELLFLLCA